jgi:hypothetical protein
MTASVLSAIQSLDGVEQVKAWNDRHYITLAAAKGSRANADLRTKIWLKGSLLTIERGKGYNSDAFIAAKSALVEATQAAGGTVREI